MVGAAVVVVVVAGTAAPQITVRFSVKSPVEVANPSSPMVVVAPVPRSMPIRSLSAV